MEAICRHWVYQVVVVAEKVLGIASRCFYRLIFPSTCVVCHTPILSLVSISQITGCTASFRFKLDAVSAPGIPEVERQRTEVGYPGVNKTHKKQKRNAFIVMSLINRLR